MNLKQNFFILVFIAGISINIFAQVNLEDTVRTEKETTRTAESSLAEEEFRRGVQSFYRGAYNESLRQFERTLSYLPGENLVLTWMGKAYYQAGIEGAAIQHWQSAQDAGYGGLLLKNKIEIVRDRRISGMNDSYQQRFTESGSFPGKNNDVIIYSQPVSVLPNSDGSIWIASYGSNELVCFDVNGIVTKRTGGPINGFDRPIDIIRLANGNMIVCEAEGDRLSLLDKNAGFIKYFGQKGRGVGQMVGPQYCAEDSFGNIYVTDFGNSRVDVFDKDGNGLFYFGNKIENAPKKSTAFKGLKSPTGIAVIDDRIFVADSVYGGIYEFDRSGNYIQKLVNERTFSRPECLKTWGKYLLVTDINRIVTVDTDDGALFENARVGNGASALTCAAVDKNGNVIVTDFKQNEVYVMSKLSELVGGLFVQIERVISTDFPKVVVEVKVENRKRQSVVGLKSENFYITENKRPCQDVQFLGSANNNDFADITFLIDRSSSMAAYNEQVEQAVREIGKSLDPRTNVKIISAGDIPVIEYSGNKNRLEEFSPLVLKSKFTSNSALDMGIRLAANDLINCEKKRGIIYVTDGTINQNSFTKYGLSDLTAYLNNNSISFTTILVDQQSLSDEVDYITKNTEGSSYYVYRPQGLSGVISDIIDIPSGLYQLSFTSLLPTEYGRKYLPLEVETYILNRSGRDETGYYAPLQ